MTQNIQSLETRREWVKNLQPGDRVAIAGTGGQIFYTETVLRRTKTGRIVLADMRQFNPDGSIYGAHAPCYRDRHLCPPEPKE